VKKLTFSLEQYSAAKATELDTKMKEAIAEDEARLLRLQARCKNVCYLMFLPLVVPLLTQTTQTTSTFDDISEEVSVTIKGGSNNSPSTFLSVCYRGP
jgi:hypothetical protein